MIRIEGVEKGYRKKGGTYVPILSIPHLRFGEGETVSLVGPSGCGKTTFLHLVSGILLPEKGRVFFRDQDLTKLSERGRDRFRARHIGYVHQTFNLLPPFSALENVILGAFFAGRSGRATRDAARALLERVGLSDRMENRPGELSVGQQQRVALARAMINAPELILADEPLGSQDPETGQAVLELLLELVRESGATLLMVTHDHRTAEILDRRVDMREFALGMGEPAR
ncbi:MAG TPA: ABC transporter ATP-binding protein [Planctomycetes bacterium]|nr:ABC transporter ATP-binding protein [Planctomycetota bacterium]